MVDIETSLTQLVECQPHRLKVVGSIPTQGTSCFNSIFIRLKFVSMEALTIVVVNLYVLRNQKKANKSDHLADYLDLTFIIDSGGKLSTRLYDKRDDFDFHIVNFPFLSSNIPSGPSYGVYISQLIRYARCCSHYDDFRYRHKCLVDRLLSQGYKALRLEKSFKKFYGRYQDLIEKYRRSVNAMVSDSFPGQFLFNM